MARMWRKSLMTGLVAVGLAGCGHQSQQTGPQSLPQTPATLSAPMPPSPEASPSAAPAAFADWLADFRAEATARGMKPSTLAALDGLQPIDRVLELDRKQPEFTLTFAEYLSRTVNPRRVAQGRTLLAQNAPLLLQVSDRYGVPAEVVVAMWGMETDFGRLTGGFQIIPALATLAYDGRRSRYFRTELMNALTIIDSGIPESQLRGSWAGAMGQCQFMPSTYLKYAQSWDGQGQPDIWTTQADVFASAANYLSRIGWNPGQGWGHAVRVPAGLESLDFGLETKKTVAQWSHLGVVLADGSALPDDPSLQASLIRAETGRNGDVGQGTPYLVFDNFRVFMKWNHSTFFALAAGTLADRLASR